MEIKVLSSKEYEEKEKNYGDCIIIHHNANVIVFDCGSEEHAIRVKDFLKGKDINNVYVILSHNDEDHISTPGLHEQEDSFQQFIGVIHEYRNCAAHQGEYWEFCFANNTDGYPTLLILNIDLEHYSRKNKREH